MKRFLLLSAMCLAFSALSFAGDPSPGRDKQEMKYVALSCPSFGDFVAVASVQEVYNHTSGTVSPVCPVAVPAPEVIFTVYPVEVDTGPPLLLVDQLCYVTNKIPLHKPHIGKRRWKDIYRRSWQPS